MGPTARASTDTPPVALVTGGAVRIGRAICERLAQEGYGVAIHARRSGELAEALAAEIVGRGGRAVVARADLADARSVRRLIGQATAPLGPVALLVNNASEFEPDEIETLDEARWERHFAVNLRAPAFLISDMARALPPDRKGAVVNIIDQRVWKLTPQFASYTLAKAALWTATRTLAQALAPRIRVNAVGPGPTLGNSRQSPGDFEQQSSSVPLGRGSSPEEIADAVVFLARADSVTGQMIAVDGGQHLAWRTPDVDGLSG